MGSDETAAMPESAMSVAAQVVLALWAAGGSWEESTQDTAGAVGQWLRDRMRDGDPQAHLKLIGALMDVAAGLAGILEHHEPGQAEAALRAATVHAQTAAFEAQPPRLGQTP